MSNEKLGGLLRGYRSALGLSREGLAERSALSVEAIRALENSRRRYPRPATIEQLSEALELQDADRLLLEEAARRPAQPASALRELPADLSDFVGREQLVEDLIGVLSSTPTAPGAVVVVAIEGMGGIGKTALAVRAAKRASEAFPGGHLYVSLGAHGSGEPVTPLAALNRILTTLGTAPADIPDDVATAAARYRAILAGRRVLLLLDDALNSTQVEPLLPGIAGSAVLVTSRRRLTGLAGARHVALDLFSEAEAVGLLDSLVEKRAAEEPHSAREVVRLCGRLPLALRIAGTYLSDRPEQSVAQLAAELADEHAKLGVLSGDDAGVRSSLMLSVDALAAGRRSVEQDAARALPLVSLLQGDDFSLRIAAAALDLPLERAEAAIEHLVDVNLVETPALRRYRLHDLIRAVGRDLANSRTTEDERVALRLRVLDKYVGMVWRCAELAENAPLRTGWRDPGWAAGPEEFPDFAAVLEAIDADRANLVTTARFAALGSAAEQQRLVPLALGMNTPARHRRRWLEWSQLCELAVDQIDPAKDPVGASLVHFDLGNSLGELGDLVRGGKHLTAAHTLALELGDDEYEAKCLINLAHQLEQSGQLTEGRDFAERCLAIGKRLDDDFLQSYARLVLGQIAGKEGDPVVQRSSFEQSIALISQIGRPSLIAMQLMVAGESYRMSREYEAAIAVLRRAEQLYRETDYVIGLAEALDHLGAVQTELGWFREALATQHEALQLAVDSQLWDREANIRTRLGQTLVAEGRELEARTEWKLALQLYTSHGSARADHVGGLLRTT